MTRQRPSRAMAGGRKCLRLAPGVADEDVGAGTHAAANQNRLADRTQRSREALVTGAKGAGCALAMDEQFTPLCPDEVGFDLADIVGHIEQDAQGGIGKEVGKAE